MPAGDSELVARAAGGDDRAFNALVHRHGGYVHALALRYTQNHADADEIAQAVFTALWRAARRWRPDAALRTWLYKVTVNRCIDRERSQRRWAWLTGTTEPDALPGDGQSGEKVLEDRAELERVREAMLELPPRQRMALLLTAVEDFSAADAAAAMDITPGALEQLLVRARRTLRKRMENGHD